MERLTFDELIVAEAWLTDKSGDEDRAMEIINKAISHLRHLMKQDLSKAELVRYLRQQMGIEPKSGPRLRRRPPAQLTSLKSGRLGFLGGLSGLAGIFVATSTA